MTLYGAVINKSKIKVIFFNSILKHQCRERRGAFGAILRGTVDYVGLWTSCTDRELLARCDE